MRLGKTTDRDDDVLLVREACAMLRNEESPTVFLLEEWRSYTNTNGEWHTVPSGFTLHTVGQALAFAEHRARQCPGVYRIAVYRRVGATEVGI